MVDKKDDEEYYKKYKTKDNAQNNEYKSGFFSDNTDFHSFTANTSYNRPTERGKLDRILGVLGNGSIVEGLYNITDDDDETTFGQGVKQGFKHMNPFEDDVSNRHTFSDVLKNIGWEDKDPDKLSLSDVGRGVVGFAGDVLLDPLSYANPLSAASKVVKGTGAAVDVAKGLKETNQVAGISDGIEALKSGKINSDKLQKLSNLSVSDARTIIRNQLPDADEQEIADRAEDLINSYASKVLKLRKANEGSDFTVGFNFLPFASKVKIGDRSLASFKKTLVKSETLRGIGDNSIAPYYNSLAKKMRTSSLGKQFSNYSQIEALGKSDSAAALAKFHTDNLLKGHDKIPLDLKDLAAADKIKEYWDGLDKKQQYEWLDAYESGGFKAAKSFQKIRAKVQEAYEKTSGKKDDFFSDAGDAGSYSKVDKLSNEIKTQFNEIENFLSTKITELADDDVLNIKRTFGKHPDEMDTNELTTAFRYLDNMKSGVTYRELMEHYNNTVKGQPPTSQNMLSMKNSEATARKYFRKLTAKEKNAVINSYKFNYSDDIAKVDEDLKSIEDKKGELLNIFMDGKQKSYYERIGNVLGDDYVKGINQTAEQLEETIRFGAAVDNKFDDEAKSIADLVMNRMSEIAKKEVAAGLLSPEQAAAMKGRYLFHINVEDNPMMRTLLYEDKNGAYNPDVLGIIKVELKMVLFLQSTVPLRKKF